MYTFSYILACRFVREFPSINQRSNSSGRARKPVDSQTRPMLIRRFRVRCRAPPSDPLKSIRSYAYISASPPVAASPTTCCCASLSLIPCLSTHLSPPFSRALSLSTHLYFSFYLCLTISNSYYRSPSHAPSLYCRLLLPLFVAEDV